MTFRELYNEATKSQKNGWSRAIAKKCNVSFSTIAYWRWNIDNLYPKPDSQTIISKIMNKPVEELFPSKN